MYTYIDYLSSRVRIVIQVWKDMTTPQAVTITFTVIVDIVIITFLDLVSVALSDYFLYIQWRNWIEKRKQKTMPE